MLCLCVSYASAECVSVRYTKIVYIYFDFVGAIRFTVKKCRLLFSSAACSNLCVWICCDGCVHIWSKAKNKLEKIINIDCFFFRLLFLSWSVSSDRCNLICFLAFIEMIAVCVCDTLSTLNYLIVFFFTEILSFKNREIECRNSTICRKRWRWVIVARSSLSSFHSFENWFMISRAIRMQNYSNFAWLARDNNQIRVRQKLNYCYLFFYRASYLIDDDQHFRCKRFSPF